MGYQIKIG